MNNIRCNFIFCIESEMCYFVFFKNFVHCTKENLIDELINNINEVSLNFILILLAFQCQHFG